MCNFCRVFVIGQLGYVNADLVLQDPLVNGVSALEF